MVGLRFVQLRFGRGRRQRRDWRTGRHRKQIRSNRCRLHIGAGTSAVGGRLSGQTGKKYKRKFSKTRSLWCCSRYRKYLLLFGFDCDGGGGGGPAAGPAFGGGGCGGGPRFVRAIDASAAGVGDGELLLLVFVLLCVSAAGGMPFFFWRFNVRCLVSSVLKSMAGVAAPRVVVPLPLLLFGAESADCSGGGERLVAMPPPVTRTIRRWHHEEHLN